MNQTKRILALALALVFVFASFTTLIAAAAEAVANPTKGDVNKNGKIDMTDYILTKRAYFNTYKLSEEQLDLADINCNDKLDMTDYILLKRMYFGTYKLPVVPETPEEDTSSDVSEDTSSDVSEDTSSDVSSDASSDVSSDTSSEDTSSNVPSTPDEDTSSDVSEDTSSDDTSSEEPALGTFDNPYIAVLNAMRIAVTIPAGGEAYVKASDSDGNVLTVGYATGSDYFAVYCRQTINPEGEDNTMAITMNADVDFVYFMNTSETDDVVLYITLVEGAPVDTTGTMDNPAEITLSEMFGALRGMGEGEVAAGGDGYWFKVVAPADGMIAVSVGAADAEYNFLDWMYCVNNTTAGKYGDNHWSDDEEVVYNEMVSVSEGDIVTIFVNTYNPEDMFNAPAGTVSATVSFSPAGSPEVPFTAVIGDNTATGSDTGAFYTYTATGDGTLTLTISDENTLGWTYFVNNLTSCVYGDTQWSDSDPVLNSFDVAVSKGDEIQIMVNTYDPADMWNAPEGEIKWSLSFTPVATTNLVAGKEYSASAEGYTQYTAENYGLTDGYTNRWTAYNSTAFCWATANTTDLKGYFVFDLGAYCTVYDVNTHIYVYEVSGIKVPAEINVYVSNDGETYTALGTSVLPSYDTSTNNWDEVRWATLSEKATDVRFVKVEFVINYGMNLVDEIQVLGIVTEELAPATPDEEDTSSEDTSSEDTSSEDTSSEDTSSEDTSSEDTSSEDTSSEDTSSEDTSSEDTSSDDTSSEPEEPTADEEEPVVNPSSNVVTVWNAGYNATNDAIIYTDADVYSSATIGWWRHIALAPVEGKDGIYEVVGISKGDAGTSGGLAVPENGFIWCAWEWPADGAGAYSIAIMNGLEVGDYVEVTGIDPVAGTNTADADIKEWIDPESKDPVNLAAGMEYTTSAEGYGQYIAANNALTNGVTNRWTTFNDSIFAFHQSTCPDLKGYITFDLGANCTITSVNSHVATYVTSGIVNFKGINVLVSTDGVTYTEFGSATMPTYAGGDEFLWANCEGSATNVRFVKIEYLIDYGFNFIDEIEIYGYAAE